MASYKSLRTLSTLSKTLSRTLPKMSSKSITTSSIPTTPTPTPTPPTTNPTSSTTYTSLAPSPSKFTPRTQFPPQLSLPRSYFLGHHAAGLKNMKTMISHIDLIIECRDYRVPLTSRNPLFEQLLQGRERLVVYTKRDLGVAPGGKKNAQVGEVTARETLLSNFHKPNTTLFTNTNNKSHVRQILEFTKTFAATNTSLVGTRILVVGMPNVGKSSLLNALRMEGTQRKKAAATGAQPGVTRSIASGVKIVDRCVETGGENIYLVDTPGVFVPFVGDSESMLKLALCGSVKDTIVPPVSLCDYLLYCINQQAQGPKLYEQYCAPTNDVMVFLEGVCRKTGRLQKGGTPEVESAALWVIQRWRQGSLGHFVLDEVSEGSLEEDVGREGELSYSQAKKLAKDVQRAKGKSRGGGGGGGSV